MRRQRFLDEMEATVPWDAFLAIIDPVYHKPSSKGGRPPIPLEMMLRIHLLQQWFTLSDPLMKEMLIDTPCFLRFAGIEPMEGHRIAEQILEGVNQMLQEGSDAVDEVGRRPWEGTILDATIINAPSSTTSKRKEKIPEIQSVAKGKQWFHYCVKGVAYGMPWHNRYADADGYEEREDFQYCLAEFRIAMKPGQRRVLPDTPEGRLLDLIETAKAHYRAKVKPFWIIKCQIGFRKIFYRGIRKNDLKLKLLLTLANPWMVRKPISDQE